MPERLEDHGDEEAVFGRVPGLGPRSDTLPSVMEADDEGARVCTDPELCLALGSDGGESPVRRASGASNSGSK